MQKNEHFIERTLNFDAEVWGRCVRGEKESRGGTLPGPMFKLRSVGLKQYPRASIFDN